MAFMNYLGKVTGLISAVKSSFFFKMVLPQVLTEINNENCLNECNVINKIKEKLRDKDLSTYQEWEKNRFSIDYKFTAGCDDLGLLFYDETLLTQALKSCNTNTANALIKAGVDVNKKTGIRFFKRGSYRVTSTFFINTPLHIAVRKGNKEIVQSLIRAGADINAKGGNSRYIHSALYIAVEEDYIEIAQFLIKAGADVNMLSGNYGALQAPLNMFARKGNKEMVQLLIDKGANINGRDEYFAQSALHIAVDEGHVEIIQLLINAGANVNMKDSCGRTPLDVLYEASWFKKILLEGKVNAKIEKLLIKAKDSYDKAPSNDTNISDARAFPVSNNEHIESDREALTNRADSILSNLQYSGNSVSSGLAHKKDNDDDRTASHEAAYKSHLEDTVNKGANPLIKNCSGKTPRDLAESVNIIQLLNEKASEFQKKNTSFNKSIMIGSVCGVIAALAVGIGCGVASVELSTLAIVGIAIATALVIGVIIAGITYLVSRPSGKLDKPDLKGAEQTEQLQTFQSVRIC